MSASPDVHWTLGEGHDAYDLMVGLGEAPMLELLVKRGADRAAKNERGETATDIAKDALDSEAVAILS